MNKHELRREYGGQKLKKKHLDPDPWKQFNQWFNEAIEKVSLDPNAFVLSTSSHKGSPSSRIVLLKEHSPEGFIFFTNYLSRKGIEISENPNVSMLFYWAEISKQIRIEGYAKKLTGQKSDEYFFSRPFDSQIASMISKQSKKIEDDIDLNEVFEMAKQSICPSEIKRPVHWGGYIIVPEKYEFWQGQAARLHDRFVYLQNSKTKNWEIIQLQP